MSTIEKLDTSLWKYWSEHTDQNRSYQHTLSMSITTTPSTLRSHVVWSGGSTIMCDCMHRCNLVRQSFYYWLRSYHIVDHVSSDEKIHVGKSEFRFERTWGRGACRTRLEFSAQRAFETNLRTSSIAHKSNLFRFRFWMMSSATVLAAIGRIVLIEKEG